MKLQSLIFCLFVLAATSLACADALAAEAPAKPAAAEFYPMLGKWHGTAQLTETGKPPVKLKMQIHCVKAAAGYAVRCSDVTRNKQMAMFESDLMGVDPVSGQAHWYAVSSQGETHDHLARWVDANHMQAHFDWQQDGKPVRETIQVEVKGRHMKFKSEVSMDGKQAAEFTGDLSR